MWPMKQILWGGIDRRLVNFLLEKSELEGDGSLRITHARIANYLGAVREVVTRMLRYFRNEGMARLNRGV